MKFLECDLCAKVYTSTYALDRHIMDIHTWRCDHCDEYFEHKSSLEQHLMEEHQGAGDLSVRPKFFCDTCEKIFSAKWSLDRHNRDIHTWKCTLCSEVYKLRLELLEHMKVAHRSEHIKPIKCGLCERKFSSIAIFLEHHQQNHSGKKFKCSDCDMYFQTIFLFENHSKLHEQNYKYVKCHVCDLVLAVANIKFHYNKKHPDVEPKIEFKCGDCSAVFKSKVAIKKHLKVHNLPGTKYEPDTEAVSNGAVQCVSPIREIVEATDTTTDSKKRRIFKCELCGSDYRNRSSLYRHKQMVHERSWRCHHCKETLLSKSSLKEHLIHVHGAVSCKCGDCSAIFNTKVATKIGNKYEPDSETVADDADVTMKKVSLIHQTENTFHEHKNQPSMKSVVTCKLCKKGFSANGALNRHIFDLHTWVCQHCELVFEYKFLLQKHLISAHPEKKDILIKPKFNCNICGRRYSAKGNLSKHIAEAHKLKCKDCEETFELEHLLIEHFTREHNGSNYSPKNPSFKCADCEKSYTTKFSLQRHTVDMHTWQCKHCNNFFKTQEVWKLHLAHEHPSSDTAQNSETYVVTELEGELNEEYSEIEDHFEIGKYECVKCTECFESFHELEAHGKSHIDLIDEPMAEESSSQSFVQPKVEPLDCGDEENIEVGVKLKIETMS